MSRGYEPQRVELRKNKQKALSSGGAFLLWGALGLVGCAPRGEYVTFTGFQQGTTYSIIVRDPAPDTAAQIDSVFRQIDLTFSMFNPQSLTSRINRNETDRVTPLFAECFRLAKQIHADTDGFYDPTVKPLVDAWGFGADEMQRRPNLDSLMEFVGLDKIAIEGPDNGIGGGWRIVKTDPRVQLDFSSIAKGFTVDRMAEMLAQTSGGAPSQRSLRRGHTGTSLDSGQDGGASQKSLRRGRTGTSLDSGQGGGASQRSLRSGWLGGLRKKPSGGVARSCVVLSGATLSDAATADFLVEIGGEIRVQGVNRQGRAWRVQIDRPEGGFAHQQAAVITLGGGRNGGYKPPRAELRDTKNHQIDPSSPRTGVAGNVDDELTETSSRNGMAGNVGGELTEMSARNGMAGNGSPKYAHPIQSGLAAVATSGNYRNQFVDEDGDTRVHTVDPHTGAQAAGEILSASVVAGSCALADGWATALIAARDLSTARRLLENARRSLDRDAEGTGRTAESTSQRSVEAASQCAVEDTGECADASQRSGERRKGAGSPQYGGAEAIEWYLITERGVEYSTEFPIENKADPSPN